MRIEYIGTIEKKEGNADIAFVAFPYDVLAHFGKKRVKIKALFDNIEYQGLLTPMGGVYNLFLRKDIRKALCKGVGDTLSIVVEEDLEMRVVELPIDFEQALVENDLLDMFQKMAFTHRKEYVVWLNDAKKIETRHKRLKKAIEILTEKNK